MKLLKTNRSDGYARVEVENQDDLWYLKDIIGEGDTVRAVTQRTKLDGREKKTLKLSLEVEKTEYDKSRLRVTGEILQADDDVELGYHTFNIEPGKEFELWKDFSQQEWDRLHEAEQKRSYQVLFCLIEKGGADLYLVEESGISSLSKLQENIPGKLYDDQKTGEGFQEELVEVIERSAEDVDNIVVAGPGFEKQKIYDMLPEDVKQKAFVQDTSVTGETGLNEAIKRGALERVTEESRISEESKVVEELLEEMEKDGNIEYGEPVKELARKGAVEKLVVTDEKFREEQDTVEKVEQQGGEVVQVHTDHEAGKRLENFGGMAAFLRYKP
ncbi:MAG: mRNA surveillance protein pelota [Candidatus Nanohaloarchaea archaeon]